MTNSWENNTPTDPASHLETILVKKIPPHCCAHSSHRWLLMPGISSINLVWQAWFRFSGHVTCALPWWLVFILFVCKLWKYSGRCCSQPNIAKVSHVRNLSCYPATDLNLKSLETSKPPNKFQSSKKQNFKFWSTFKEFNNFENLKKSKHKL